MAGVAMGQELLPHTVRAEVELILQCIPRYQKVLIQTNILASVIITCT